MKHLTFILGGCRSGKSRFALETAASFTAECRIFIATAVPFDDEMRARVLRHQAERGALWLTVEAAASLPEAIQEHGHRPANLLLVDCLTLWASHLLLEAADAGQVLEKIPLLVAALQAARCPVVVVSNEVGAGIVPENKLARAFRDLVGSMNQAVAACAQDVFWVVAGIPVAVKQNRRQGPDEEF